MSVCKNLVIKPDSKKKKLQIQSYAVIVNLNQQQESYPKMLNERKNALNFLRIGIYSNQYTRHRNEQIVYLERCYNEAIFCRVSETTNSHIHRVV